MYAEKHEPDRKSTTCSAATTYSSRLVPASMETIALCAGAAPAEGRGQRAGRRAGHRADGGRKLAAASACPRGGSTGSSRPRTVRRLRHDRVGRRAQPAAVVDDRELAGEDDAAAGDRGVDTRQRLRGPPAVDDHRRAGQEPARPRVRRAARERRRGGRGGAGGAGRERTRPLAHRPLHLRRGHPAAHATREMVQLAEQAAQRTPRGEEPTRPPACQALRPSLVVGRGRGQPAARQQPAAGCRRPPRGLPGAHQQAVGRKLPAIPRRRGGAALGAGAARPRACASSS